jgi:hypothetical protein
MKEAAVWWRVSTEDQREMSPDTQIAEALAMAQEEGYTVPEENILGTDWHSLSVWDSPPMERLKELIRTQAIQRVFMYEPDRAPSKPAHRLLFRALCEEHGVGIRCRHGQIPDGDMGEVMEFLSAWAKEKQVHRAQQGARDGLRDRARLKGLPPSPRNPYGYAWNAERTRLQPTPGWPNAEFICRAGLDGMPARKIRQELHSRGIPSPTGLPWWPAPTIYGIQTNPLYGGRFHALRKEQVEPRQRKVLGYGKTSTRRKPITEAVYLSRIVVESPPLTWEEWLALQDRLKVNKLEAQRNAKRDYLLRSLIVCDTHRRRYHGRGHHRAWCYACPACYEEGAEACPRPFLPGPRLEERVKAICREVLTSPEIIEREIRQGAGRVGLTLESLQKNMAALNRKEARNRATEANLLLERAKGNASPEAYEQCLALTRAERTWIAEERQRLEAQRDTMLRGEATLLGLAEMREKLLAKLDSAANEDWRQVFGALALEVRVTERGDVEAALAIPVEKPSIVLTTPPPD